jgi:hypothetical protein
MYHPFSILETLKISWHILKSNFAVIIIFSIISFVILGVLGTVIGFVYSPDDFLGSMVLFFIEVVIQAYTTLGLYKLIFTVIDSELYEFEFRQVLPGFKMLYSYIVVAFIIAFIVADVGFLLARLDAYDTLQFVLKNVFIVVALYFALRIMFFITFIVDDKSGPLESIMQSFKLTKGYFIKVVLILLIILILIAIPAYISGFFPLASLLIIVTYPFVSIILAVTYRKLVYSHQDVDDDVSESI